MIGEVAPDGPRPRPVCGPATSWCGWGNGRSPTPTTWCRPCVPAKSALAWRSSTCATASAATTDGRPSLESAGLSRRRRVTPSRDLRLDRPGARPPCPRALRLSTLGRHGGLPPAVDAPVGPQRLLVRPEPDRQSGGVRGAEAGGLGDRGPPTGASITSAWICSSSSLAVMPPSTLRVVSSTRLCPHRLHDVGHLPGGGLQRRPRQMRLGDVRGETGDDAPRVSAPVRREQPGERRHEVAAAVVVDGGGQSLICAALR